MFTDEGRTIMIVRWFAVLPSEWLLPDDVTRRNVQLHEQVNCVPHVKHLLSFAHSGLMKQGMDDGFGLIFSAALLGTEVSAVLSHCISGGEPRARECLLTMGTIGICLLAHKTSVYILQ